MNTLAISIKSYLKFCKMLEIKPWSPVSPDDDLRVDYEQNYEEVDVATQYDEVMTIQPTKKKRHSQSTEPGEKAKKTRNCTWHTISQIGSKYLLNLHACFSPLSHKLWVPLSTT